MKKIVEVLAYIGLAILTILTVGWWFMYACIDLKYDWSEVKGIWKYSLLMFVVVVIGTCLEIFVLGCVFGGLVGVCAFVYNLWYMALPLALPLALVFLVIVCIRWIQLLMESPREKQDEQDS